ncbi:MAG: hypothetical protein ACF8NJ_09265, partial [Phycisphaerales bacterium JB038]
METEVHDKQGRRSGSPRERGSVIIFAVGVLVLLAVMAAVFLTSSQQQRETGTATVIQHMTSRSGPGAPRVMDHIVDIISRDVFDPMTPTTYLTGGQTPLVPSSPSTFEVWDYPYTRQTLDGFPTVGNPLTFNKGGDDPWLADIDPRPAPGAFRLGLLEDAATYDTSFGYWMNISKLHPLGTFVKIGYDEGGGDTGNPADYDVVDAATNTELGDPTLPDGVDMSTGNGIFATPPTALLDREWADADGDGHYDSRWWRLDGLDDRAGVTFYLAGRVIDLSGMINLNTAASYSTGSGPDFAPALASDVDLLRFLSTPDYGPFSGYTPADLPAESPFGFEELMISLGYAR